MEPDRCDALDILARAADELEAHESGRARAIGSLVGIVFFAVLQGGGAVKKIATLFKMFVVPNQRAFFVGAEGAKPNGTSDELLN